MAHPKQRGPAAAGHRQAIGTVTARQQVVVPPGRTYLACSEQAAQLGEPAEQMELLSSQHHLVKAIAAERQCTAHTDKASRLRVGRRQEHTQGQVLVHWEDTIEEDWSLAAHERLGYEPAECQPTTFDAVVQDSDMYDRLACELCGSPDSANMLICSTCDRMYHSNCMGMGEVPSESEDFHCECCTNGEPGQRRLYKVSWRPHWEPKEAIPQHLLQAFHQRRLQENPAKRHRPAGWRGAPTNLQNQGIFDGPRRKPGYEADTAGLLHISHRATNPHTDIAPTHRFVVEVREEQARHQAGKGKSARAVDVRYLAACVYGLDGRCVGQMEPARLYHLHACFQTVRRERPELCDELKSGSFEEEVYKLLIRYKRSGQAHQQRYRNWAVPSDVIGVLHTHLGLDTARMSSPLTYDMRMAHYWTAHERDQLFGAGWDAHNSKWTGYSECSPDLAHRDMEKAVRWAVHSAASTDVPTATVMILPDWSIDASTAYRRWIKAAPAHCLELVKVNGRCFRFQEVDAWKGCPTHHDHPPWGVTILLVANAPGFADLRSRVDIGEMAADLQTVVAQMKDPRCNHAGTITCIDHHIDRVAAADHSPAVTIPDKFKRLPTDGRASRLPTEADAAAPARFEARHDLLLDWEQLVYTDGSVRTGGKGAARVGSGIYAPGRTETLLDPAGSGITNTINRAELAPILYALKHDLGDTIATDSACSLHQIQRYIHDPSGMERHIHRPILHLIAEAIADRARKGKPTRLIKVAAHSGIVGNERADELAKRAGGEQDGDDQPETEVCPAPATTPLHDLFWPTHREAGEDGQPRLRHVPDLSKGLKRWVHERHRLGYADQGGLYFNAWRGAAPTAHGSYSNGFMALPTGVDARTRKLVLQARYGTLNTARWRYKCRLASSLNCQLCGDADGGHHSLSGCTRMVGMYTQRHNEAGGIIYSTLAKGGMGAALVMQDIGRHNAAAGDPEAARRIGTRLPPEIRQLFGDTDRVSRPDILIAHDLHVPHQAAIHIVEIKYCRDTDRAVRQADGTAQHELLVRKLKEKYHLPWQVSLHVITLGVTGTIYTDMLEMLKEMQVDTREAQRCAKKLHVHAVNYVQRIMHTKWNQEHARGPDGPS
jgi:ribonuclease HI